MRIISSLDDIKIENKTVVALGNFDGIHLGHRVVLEDAVKQAKEKRLTSVCYTFSNHPFNFIMHRDENDPNGIKLICTEKQKIRMLEEIGFDILVNVAFDEDIMKMRARQFIDEILKNKLNAAVVSVGFNYSFGARAEGTPKLLKEECDRHGIDVRIHNAVVVGDKIVSSTLIRETISVGDMEKVSEYLGRDYSFEGEVQEGRKIGTSLGFPTANLPTPTNRALPPDGVYFGRIELTGSSYRCITNIGNNPTVSDGLSSLTKTIETYIFDYDGNCYGDHVCVYFEHFHRPEIDFEDRNALHEQIAEDCELAKKFKT